MTVCYFPISYLSTGVNSEPKIAFWINYGCLLHTSGPKQWIIPIALQAVPAIILFFGMLFSHESPRYLAQKNPTAALRTLAKLRNLPENHPYAVEEMANLERHLEEEIAVKTTSRWTFLKEAFWIRSYRRRSVLCITLMMWSNLTGTNAMTYYSPTIFNNLGLSGAQSGLFATGIYGFIKMASCFTFITFVSDSMGRRKSLLWAGAVQVRRVSTSGFVYSSSADQSTPGPSPLLCRLLRPL
jgi:hypothetical protein